MAKDKTTKQRDALARALGILKEEGVTSITSNLHFFLLGWLREKMFSDIDQSQVYASIQRLISDVATIDSVVMGKPFPCVFKENRITKQLAGFPIHFPGDFDSKLFSRENLDKDWSTLSNTPVAQVISTSDEWNSKVWEVVLHLELEKLLTSADAMMSASRYTQLGRAL